MIMKTAMGIATKNLAAWGEGSLFGALYSPTVIEPGYKAAEEGGRPEATRALLLMPDPVNAWSRSVAADREGRLSGITIMLAANPHSSIFLPI